MNQLNSYTSSSNIISPIRATNALHLGVWVVAALVMLDVFINLAFPYPTDPKVLNPSGLQLYFDYGRSVEGKLARMTRPDRGETAPITLAGWYDPLEVQQLVTSPTNPVITFYGMSHTVRLAHALARVSDRFNPRIIAAPGASENWEYGAFLRDSELKQSRAAVLALWSQNLAMVTTMSPMTWGTDAPMPYTADRFYLQGDDLTVAHPPYTSYPGYVATFYDQQKWAAAINIFSKYDTMYNSFVFRKTFLDRSAFVRLIRRAYAQRLSREARHAVLDSTGFQPDSEAIKVAREIIRQFAIRCRNEGITPIIYLVNGLGDSNYLFQAVKPVLMQGHIPYLNSAEVAPSNDPRNYLPDSHFTDIVDDRLAAALVRLIEANEAH